jgi:predicted DNA binding CopG/RHH family protein
MYKKVTKEVVVMLKKTKYEIVAVRLSEKDKAALVNRAEKERLGMSSWIRNIIIRELRKDTEKIE